MLRDSTKNVCPLVAILKNKRTLFKQEWKKTFILHVAQILGEKKLLAYYSQRFEQSQYNEFIYGKN